MDGSLEPECRDHLPWLDGTILAAMRSWVLASRRGVPAEPAIDTIFANLRAPEAAEHLHHLMRGLSQGCTRMIEVHCTCEPYLSADEVLLLDSFAMLQEKRHDGATSLLRAFTTPAAAYAASAHALAIVQLLNDAGHTITRGPDALRRHIQDSEDCGTDIAMPMRLH
jgi:hypothetical protein